MNEQEVAYVAGFFDGEGCACICKNFSVKVMVVQKKPEVLFWMNAHFKGNVNCRGKNYCWQISNKANMEVFLKAIRPYLRVKEADVDMCLKMLSLSNTNSTRPQAKNGHFQKNPKQEEREKLYRLYKVYRKS